MPEKKETKFKKIKKTCNFFLKIADIKILEYHSIISSSYAVTSNQTLE